MTLILRTGEAAIGPFAPPRPSMRGPYLIRSRPKALAMRLIDAGLSLVPKRRTPAPERLERLLVSDWGHLGDVLSTFGAIAAVRKRHPNVRIGMVMGSWGRAAIEATGLVDDVHVIDHWSVNRSAASAGEKWARYRRTRTEALATIRAADYQAAIDFYPFFPVAHPLFFRAGIGLRVGFVSGGFGPLLTHAVPWPDRDRPIADHYRDLLDALSPGRPFAAADLRPRRSRDTLAPLPEELAAAAPYAVLHGGAGAPFKDWGLANWRELIARLQSERPDLRLVLTGAGAAEAAVTAELAATFPNLINVSGRADWERFVSIVAHAERVVCPDTATGHIAALFDVPVVSIFTGTNNAAQWAPYSDRAKVLVRAVTCAPCNRPGCEAMACIRGVTPDAVLKALASR